MKNKIFVLGCSHVSGHGFEDNVKGDTHSVHAWPAKIAKDFNCEVIDKSWAGQGVDSCVMHLQEYPHKDELGSLIVMLPFSRRMLQRVTSNGKKEDMTFLAHPINVPYWDRIMDQYMKHCHNEKMYNVNFLSYYTYFRFISQQFKIPLWIGANTLGDRQILEMYGHRVSWKYDWMEWCIDNNFPRCPDGHFAHLAHETFYQDVIKPWLTNFTKITPL